MVALGVVARVGGNALKGDVATGLPENAGEEADVVAGAAASERPGDQVRVNVAGQRELGPVGLRGVGSPQLSSEVAADVARLEPRRVDGRLRALLDQAEAASSAEDGGQEAVKAPLF